MPFIDLFKKLLPGFLPILIFIVADEIWGTTVGICVALAIGIVSLVVTFIKDKKLDKFILFDTLLIVALGGVSLLLNNDVFFKIKPALIGLLMCILMGVSIFTPKNFMLALTQRYMGNMQINNQQIKMLNRSLRNMFYIFAAYTLLVFYSVWFMTTEAWAFISGGFFYILFGAYFLYEFINKKIKTKKNENIEWLPLVDTKGNVIGQASRDECHTNKTLLHPVVHLHIVNNNQQLYLQKRPLHKLVQPGKWDTAMGGHISFNETIEQALERETREELGINVTNPRFLFKYVWESNIETELVFCFLAIHNGTIIPNKNELDGGKFWNITDIEKKLGINIFTPNFEHEFVKIKPIIKKL